MYFNGIIVKPVTPITKMYHQSEDAMCECKGIQLAYSVSCNNVTFWYSQVEILKKNHVFIFLSLILIVFLIEAFHFKKQ